MNKTVFEIWSDWIAVRPAAYMHEHEIMDNMPAFCKWTVRDAEIAQSLILQLEGRIENGNLHRREASIELGPVAAR